MDIKIAFTDIDGTLLNSEREVSEMLKQQVARITQQDIPFILISSRMPSAMTHIQKDLNISDLPIICYNGGLIIADGEVINDISIPPTLLEDILELNPKGKVHLSLYNNDDWYVPDLDFWAKREENNTKVTPIVKPTADVINLWISEGKGAHKVMCMGDKEDIDIIYSEIGKLHGDKLHLYRSKDTYIEIANKKISKLTGIQELLACKYPKLNLENCIAFGDNYNDIEMLKAVKLGVAVGNAKEEVLLVADAISDINKKDGVAKAIQKFI
ncbi:Cof-type HAD-IIB family hydrolase [Ochrovirga pacifica]|uniref:Cof-type HAD-IIB family hydrolase n=1 Tax=Ochrovirga pacifica TaxID=1042376 RepID=UPI0002559D58|nr:Cof-type HAD-IIB family hydrolase [Ochrovirga pacifica]